MKKVALFVLLVVMFFSVAVVSADPQNGANAYAVTNVTCDDGYSGDVLAPTSPSIPGFFDEEIGGLGIRRAITVTVGGEVVYAWEHPGIGFYDRLVNCSYEIDGALIEVKVQRMYTGGGE
jgi:hypothetical protein